MCLFAYRLSTEEMKANQLQLYLSVLAYTLVKTLRRLTPEGHRVGRGAGRYHPAQAVQDRRAGPYQRPMRVAGDEFLLSVEAHLRRAFDALRC